MDVLVCRVTVLTCTGSIKASEPATFPRYLCNTYVEAKMGHSDKSAPAFSINENMRRNVYIRINIDIVRYKNIGNRIRGILSSARET